jgi:hypothetical protein
MKHLSEEDLVLLYYGESGVPRNARMHLSDCAACRSAAESLAQTLDVCSEWAPPEVAPEFGRDTWARLAPALENHRVAKLRWWIAAAALAAVLIAAFVAGRATSHPAPTITAGLSRQARERIVQISLADHLDRAQLLLTEVANMSDSESAKLASERARAKDLVKEGRLLRQWSRNDESTAILDEVERFVIELANAPDRLGSVEIRELKRHLDSESLLFKVRIIESNLRTSGQRL